MALRSVGGGRAFFCLVQHKDAGDGFLRQNMMPRRLRAHPAKRRRNKKKKKGRVTPGGGGGGGEITHPLVSIESDKVQIPQGSRCDATE